MNPNPNQEVEEMSMHEYSVESHTGILNWLPVCAVQAPGIDQVPLLVRTTRIRYWFLPMSGYW